MDRSTHSLIYRHLDLQSDLTTLVSLLNDVAQADHTGEKVTEETLREQLTWSGKDPALNNWVVVQPNSSSFVAYGIISKALNDKAADIHLAVLPSWRRQGIGKRLLAHLLERADELDTHSLRVYVDVRNEEANLFVRTHGFEPVSAYRRLSMAGKHSFPPLVLPQGFAIRSYDQIERADLYTEALNRGYEGLWGHLQCDQEEIAHWLQQSHMDHTGIFLLFAPDGTIAGTCRADLNEQLTAERGTPIALIDAPGVVPEYRDANLFLPLLLTTIDWLLPQNPTTLELDSWGDAPSTIALYASLGFSTIKEEISYRRTLKP